MTRKEYCKEVIKLINDNKALLNISELERSVKMPVNSLRKALRGDQGIDFLDAYSLVNTIAGLAFTFSPLNVHVNDLKNYK